MWAMWAQLIKVRVKSGKESELQGLFNQLQALEEPDSGWVRSTATRDQKDPSQLYILVVFESEEKARARERDPQRQQAVEPVNVKMAEVFEGPPEFVDLEVMEEIAS
jgi:heme-degrading monooxygenase HmoA